VKLPLSTAEATMQPFAPEFAQFWLNGQRAGADAADSDRHDDEATAQRAALEDLAERVALARSIS
jgi:hypothetical protein